MCTTVAACDGKRRPHRRGSPLQNSRCVLQENTSQLSSGNFQAVLDLVRLESGPLAIDPRHRVLLVCQGQESLFGVEHLQGAKLQGFDLLFTPHDTHGTLLPFGEFQR